MRKIILLVIDMPILFINFLNAQCCPIENNMTICPDKCCQEGVPYSNAPISIMEDHFHPKTGINGYLQIHEYGNARNENGISGHQNYDGMQKNRSHYISTGINYTL